MADHAQLKPNHILVEIITTSGSYPPEGHDEVPENQPLHVELEKAAHKLELTRTSGWIATAAGRDLDPRKSYAENSLVGRVEIDWGPREGGGGASR